MTKAEQQKLWVARIADYRASGLKVREWCAAHEVTPRQLWYWLQKFKHQQDASPVTRWLPVDLSGQLSSDQGSTLLVKVGQAGIEVGPGFDPDLLSQVVRVLAVLC